MIFCIFPKFFCIFINFLFIDKLKNKKYFFFLIDEIMNHKIIIEYKKKIQI